MSTEKPDKKKRKKPWVASEENKIYLLEACRSHPPWLADYGAVAGEWNHVVKDCNTMTKGGLITLGTAKTQMQEMFKAYERDIANEPYQQFDSGVITTPTSIQSIIQTLYDQYKAQLQEKGAKSAQKKKVETTKMVNAEKGKHIDNFGTRAPLPEDIEDLTIPRSEVTILPSSSGRKRSRTNSMATCAELFVQGLQSLEAHQMSVALHNEAIADIQKDELALRKEEFDRFDSHLQSELEIKREELKFRENQAKKEEALRLQELKVRQEETRVREKQTEMMMQMIQILGQQKSKE